MCNTKFLQNSHFNLRQSEDFLWCRFGAAALKRFIEMRLLGADSHLNADAWYLKTYIL